MIDPNTVRRRAAAPLAIALLALSGAALAQGGPAGIQASHLLDADVTNMQDEEVGEVVDVILGGDGSVESVVLSVGGFLGMGEHQVAVPFGDLTITSEDPSDPEDDDLVVKGDLTKASLEAMPATDYDIED